MEGKSSRMSYFRPTRSTSAPGSAGRRAVVFWSALGGISFLSAIGFAYLAITSIGAPKKDVESISPPNPRTVELPGKAPEATRSGGRPAEAGLNGEVRSTGLEGKGEAADPSLNEAEQPSSCLLYTSPSPRDRTRSRMPSSA